MRPPGGGLKGLEELDVVGLDFKNDTAYLCEVTTHIRGLQYGDKRATIDRIRRKYKRQQAYAQEYLKDYGNKRLMYWSPVVAKGYKTRELGKIRGLELVINEDYAARIEELRSEAGKRANDEGNFAFRVLQILEHLRG